MNNLIDKYIQRIMVDYPEADKLHIDLKQFAQELLEDKPEYKYVWFNINTGEFGDSFTEEERKKYLNESDMKVVKYTGWKLIRYKCETDESFDFYSKMKIVTNIKDKK